MNLEDVASICIGYPLTTPELHRVAHHHHKSFSIIWDELSRRRFCRIGLLTDKQASQRVSHHWLASYLAHSHQQPSRHRVPVFEYASGDDPRAIDRFARWLRRYRPEAVITIGTES